MSLRSFLYCALFVAFGACNSAVTQEAPSQVESGVALERGQLTLNPSSLEFGDHCAGVRVEREVSIGNSGSAALNVVFVGLDEDASDDFQIVNPDAVLGWLSPGQSRTLILRYTPSGGDLDGAVLEVRSSQDFVGELVPLSGGEGGPALQTSPLSVDLGAVAVGSSHVEGILLRSAGTTPLAIYELALESTVEGVSLEGAQLSQGIKTLPSGDTMSVNIRLSPQAYQAFDPSPIAQLVVSSSDCQSEERSVPVYGWPGGIDRPCMGVIEEVFEGRDALATDVLFIVDNSDSMLGEQDALVEGFSAFISLAEALELDYRIGVITTDVAQEGSLVGEVIGPESAEDFADNAKVGTGGPDQEQGLASAAMALQGPSSMGGVLRDGAFLVLIFVSDEDDQSPDTVSSYLSTYYGALKGASERLMVHAIVGPEGGCESAFAGERYRALVEEVGGVSSSICEPDFGAALTEIGLESFGYKTRFHLNHAATPGSVEVSLDGVLCSSGWSLSEDGRRIDLQVEGGCLADLGQSLTIRYAPICWEP